MSSPPAHHTPTWASDFVIRQMLSLLSFMMLLGMLWDWENGWLALSCLVSSWCDSYSICYMVFLFWGAAILETKNDWKLRYYLLSYAALGYISFVTSVCMVALAPLEFNQYDFLTYASGIIKGVKYTIGFGIFIPIGIVFALIKALINLLLLGIWKIVRWLKRQRVTAHFPGAYS